MSSRRFLRERLKKIKSLWDGRFRLVSNVRVESEVVGQHL